VVAHRGCELVTRSEVPPGQELAEEQAFWHW
jgi:hypothetical protein